MRHNVKTAALNVRPLKVWKEYVSEVQREERAMDL